MNQMLSVPKRRMWLRAALAMIYALALSSSAAAGPSKIVRGEASGNITSQEFCSATELCQESTVAGQATQIGQFVGNSWRDRYCSEQCLKCFADSDVPA